MNIWGSKALRRLALPLAVVSLGAAVSVGWGSSFASTSGTGAVGSVDTSAPDPEVTAQSIVFVIAPKGDDNYQPFNACGGAPTAQTGGAGSGTEFRDLLGREAQRVGDPLHAGGLHAEQQRRRRRPQVLQDPVPGGCLPEPELGRPPVPHLEDPEEGQCVHRSRLPLVGRPQPRLRGLRQQGRGPRLARRELQARHLPGLHGARPEGR